MNPQRIHCGNPGLPAALLVLALSMAAGTLAAQEPGMAAQPEPPVNTTVQVLNGDLVDELPADRITAALPLRPGINLTSLGEPLLRGSARGDAAIYLDGVPVLSGFRGTAFFRAGLFDALAASPSPGTNTIEMVEVTTGPMPAHAGNGRAGVIAYRTRSGSGQLRGGLGYESEEAFGGGVGRNRIEGNIEGVIASRLSLFAAGVLEGQRSMSTGFDAERAPLFQPAGVDTVLTVPQSFDPAAPTSQVPVFNYAASERAPASTVSDYQFFGKATYAIAEDASVSLLALASQDQNRNFDYGNLDNPQALTGNRSASAVYALSLRQPLRRSERSPMVLEAHLSYQTDRQLSGPLTPAAAADLDSPFGGLSLAPVRHRFDFNSFPLDEELIRNYQQNLPGTRRSPFDLENPSQYMLVDQFRNNAYGLYNFGGAVPLRFFDGGGPQGRLTLYRENRWVGAAALNWALSSSHRLKVGGEMVRYAIGGYSHLLAEQLESDAHLERPTRMGIFAEDQFSLAGVSLTVGVRFDHFSTGARRPPFPVISTHPLYNPSDPDAYFQNDSLFPQDEGHGKLSPHFQAAVPVGKGTVFRAAYAQQVQMPDMRLALAGINSDINLVGSNQEFGSDLDFERTNTFELGVRHGFGENTVLDASAFQKRNHDDVVLQLVNALDPTTGVNSNFRTYRNTGAGKIRGLDVRLDRRFSSALSASVAYSYQDAVTVLPAAFLFPGDEIPMLESRPHSVAGILALQLPTDWQSGTATGNILSGLGLFATFRASSGAPYTRCFDASAISGENCLPGGGAGLNEERLPAYKQLDARLTKSLALGGRALTFYLDVRNVLNTRNILAVFASSGRTSSPAERDFNRSMLLDEYSREALQSGARRSDGAIDLSFGGLTDPRAGCSTWQTEAGIPAAPNCVYLIRAEERFGNGDHVFDLAEQTRAVDALYLTLRGVHNFTGAPRRARLGLELQF